MFDDNIFLLINIRFQNLQNNVQKLQYLDDGDFYEFLFRKLIFVLHEILLDFF